MTPPNKSPKNEPARPPIYAPPPPAPKRPETDPVELLPSTPTELPPSTPTNHASNPPAAAVFVAPQYPLALGLLPRGKAVADDPPRAAQQPPFGAPRVRAGVTTKARTAAAVVPQKLLEKTAQAALLWTGAQDATYFRVDFRDEFLHGVVCVVAVQTQRVQATFYVPDVDTRRLLEGEAARLRANLEARGLKNAEVHVSLTEPPGDWPC